MSQLHTWVNNVHENWLVIAIIILTLSAVVESEDHKTVRAMIALFLWIPFVVIAILYYVI